MENRVEISHGLVHVVTGHLASVFRSGENEGAVRQIVLLHNEIYQLELKIKQLQRWAAFCYCCAECGEKPSTRKEFETREAAKAKEGEDGHESI